MNGAADTAEVQERGIPQLNVRRGGVPMSIKLVGIVAILLAVLAAVAYVGVSKFREKWQSSQEPEQKAETRRRLPDLEVPGAVDDSELPPPPEHGADATAAPPGSASAQGPQGNAAPAQVDASGQPVVPALTPEQQAQAELLARRQKAPLVAYDASPTASGPSAAGDAGGATPSGAAMAWPFPPPSPAVPPAPGLRDALQPTVVSASSAAALRDSNMMLTQASIMPCVLNTAIDSTVPGMVSCTLTSDIYSTNGRVLLLERGSRIVGQYENAALKQGMRRVFVLWTRVETPRGVVIALDSPASDAQGRSGVGGLVNNHFWQRFGAAMLLSVVDDTLAYATQRGSGGGGPQFSSTGQAGQDAAAIAVQNSVGIPPTLSVAAGSLLNVFVARDLDFGSVYSLRTASR